MAYDNTNSGILTRNDKQGNESRPDYKGSINVDGIEYWLSAWIKEGRDGTKLAGQKYMSLSVQPKEARQEYAAPAPAPAPAPTPAAAPRRQTQAEQDARAAAERRERERAAPPKTGTGFDDMEEDLPF